MARIISGGGVFRGDKTSPATLPTKVSGGQQEFDNVVGAVGKVLALGDAVLTNETIGAIIAGLGRLFADGDTPLEDNPEIRGMLDKAVALRSNKAATPSNAEATIDSIVADSVGNTAGKKAITQNPSSREYPATPSELTKSMLKGGLPAAPVQSTPRPTTPIRPEDVRQLQIDRLYSAPTPQQDMDSGSIGIGFDELISRSKEQPSKVTPGMSYADLLVLASQADSVQEAHDILKAVKSAPDIQPNNLLEALTGKHLRVAEEKMAEVLAKAMHLKGRHDEVSKYVKWAEAQSKLMTAESMGRVRDSQIPFNEAKTRQVDAKTAQSLGPEWDRLQAQAEMSKARTGRILGAISSARRGGTRISRAEIRDTLRAYDRDIQDVTRAEEAASRAKIDSEAAAAGYSTQLMELEKSRPTAESTMTKNPITGVYSEDRVNRARSEQEYAATQAKLQGALERARKEAAAWGAKEEAARRTKEEIKESKRLIQQASSPKPRGATTEVIPPNAAVWQPAIPTPASPAPTPAPTSGRKDAKKYFEEMK